MKRQITEPDEQDLAGLYKPITASLPVAEDQVKHIFEQVHGQLQSKRLADAALPDTALYSINAAHTGCQLRSFVADNNDMNVSQKPSGWLGSNCVKPETDRFDRAVHRHADVTAKSSTNLVGQLNHSYGVKQDEEDDEEPGLPVPDLYSQVMMQRKHYLVEGLAAQKKKVPRKTKRITVRKGLNEGLLNRLSSASGPAGLKWLSPDFKLKQKEEVKTFSSRSSSKSSVDGVNLGNSLRQQNQRNADINGSLEPVPKEEPLPWYKERLESDWIEKLHEQDPLSKEEMLTRKNHLAHRIESKVKRLANFKEKMAASVSSKLNAAQADITVEKLTAMISKGGITTDDDANLIKQVRLNPEQFGLVLNDTLKLKIYTAKPQQRSLFAKFAAALQKKIRIMMTKGKEEEMKNKHQKLIQAKSATGNLKRIFDQPQHQKALNLKDKDGKDIGFTDLLRLNIDKNIKTTRGCKYKNGKGYNVQTEVTTPNTGTNSVTDNDQTNTGETEDDNNYLRGKQINKNKITRQSFVPEQGARFYKKSEVDSTKQTYQTIHTYRQESVESEYVKISIAPAQIFNTSRAEQDSNQYKSSIEISKPQKAYQSMPKTQLSFYGNTRKSRRGLDFDHKTDQSTEQDISNQNIQVKIGQPTQSRLLSYTQKTSMTTSPMNQSKADIKLSKDKSKIVINDKRSYATLFNKPKKLGDGISFIKKAYENPNIQNQSKGKIPDTPTKAMSMTGTYLTLSPDISRYAFNKIASSGRPGTSFQRDLNSRKNMAQTIDDKRRFNFSDVTQSLEMVKNQNVFRLNDDPIVTRSMNFSPVAFQNATLNRGKSKSNITNFEDLMVKTTRETFFNKRTINNSSSFGTRNVNALKGKLQSAAQVGQTILSPRYQPQDKSKHGVNYGRKTQHQIQSSPGKL